MTAGVPVLSAARMIDSWLTLLNGFFTSRKGMYTKQGILLAVLMTALRTSVFLARLSPVQKAFLHKTAGQRWSKRLLMILWYSLVRIEARVLGRRRAGLSGAGTFKIRVVLASFRAEGIHPHRIYRFSCETTSAGGRALTWEGSI